MKNKEKPRGPFLGAHMSIAGGVGNAFLEGQKVDCDAIQIFTKSSRQWASKPLTERRDRPVPCSIAKKPASTTVVAHDSYLLNLGSPDPALRTRSVAAFIDEMERCEVLGVSQLDRPSRRPCRRRRTRRDQDDRQVVGRSSHGLPRLRRSRSPWKSPPARDRTWATASSRSAT